MAGVPEGTAILFMLGACPRARTCLYRSAAHAARERATCALTMGKHMGHQYRVQGTPAQGGEPPVGACVGARSTR
tara:strand:+ start:227 stop:451 length:225 start_codon:yes stop_codon:yes gene_type:complete